ncbi:histidine kinase [Cryobacterium sp. SO2]|uniref:sensor histidine kinase n=1 Tax=Cryobacterium sp. SO2 TaxID=1897060 RepID=UPI00223DF907|nr:histidine kinase [Cryobacterium sp. SO2]WEO76577.1 histidine kinase [Cryobacterium sp. SO2]
MTRQPHQIRAPRLPRAPRRPMGARGGAVLQIVTTVIMGLAILVELVMVVQAGFPLGGVVAVITMSAGVGLIYRFPYPALALVAAAPLVAAILGWAPISNWSIACFAAFLLTLRGLSGFLTGAVIAAANLASVWIVSGTLNPAVNAEASVAGFAAAATAAAGSAVRESRRYWRELERRTADAIATRAAAVDRSVAEERLRIARDLHDSIGHEIAVVNMHLGAAEVHLPPEAQASRADLAAAQRSVQAVLRETQQILRILRVGSEADDLAPTPEHGRIPALIESYRQAGLTVEATLGDLSLPLPPQVSAAAYRITQEALTNAHKHGTGTVSVRLGTTDPGALIIEVVNMRRPGATGSALGGGHGLVGMQERAASIGGRVDVQSDESLFWMTATLPSNGGNA